MEEYDATKEDFFKEYEEFKRKRQGEVRQVSPERFMVGMPKAPIAPNAQNLPKFKDVIISKPEIDKSLKSGQESPLIEEQPKPTTPKFDFSLIDRMDEKERSIRKQSARRDAIELRKQLLPNEKQDFETLMAEIESLTVRLFWIDVSHNEKKVR